MTPTRRIAGTVDPEGFGDVDCVCRIGSFLGDGVDYRIEMGKVATGLRMMDGTELDWMLNVKGLEDGWYWNWMVVALD